MEELTKDDHKFFSFTFYLGISHVTHLTSMFQHLYNPWKPQKTKGFPFWPFQGVYKWNIGLNKMG